MFNIEAYAVILEKMPMFIYWLFWIAVGFLFLYVALVYARKTWHIIKSEYNLIKHHPESSKKTENW